MFLTANKIIKKYGFSNPDEIEPEAIANAENIVVKNETVKSYQGRIIFGDGYGLIKVNSKVKDENQRRFIISHELGHFFSDDKGLAICTALDLISFKSNKKYENNANIFASELLMYEPWFKHFCKSKNPGSDLLQNISSYFRVSITAAAIRYATIGDIAIAVIMSKNGFVQWSYMNKYFPFQFVKINQKVNSYSYCDGFFKGDELNTDVNEILSDAWFLNDFNYKREYYLKEQNINMPNYNSVLTILWE